MDSPADQVMSADATATENVITEKLHVFFFPFMAQGHMIPMIDAAKLFAARGAKASVVLSPFNASVFENTIVGARNSGLNIQLLVLDLPSDFGFPKETQNLDQLRSQHEINAFMRESRKLETPFLALVRRRRPTCIVSDLFFPWTAGLARSVGVPRLAFNVSSFFFECVHDTLVRLRPYADAASDSEAFLVPGLPDRVELTRSQIPRSMMARSEITELFERVREAETKSHGVITNSFYELEPAYVDLVRYKMGKKAWHIGPVSACHTDSTTSVNSDDCLKHWLQTQKPNSVLYLCFGSLGCFSPSQLDEIAVALESSDCSFIWVVKKDAVLKDDFVERTKGLIIRGWAPQVKILNHPAVGGFVTHCGWNSVLEGISAGVPMITWPIFAEQFYNEKLVTDVLGVGVGVGNRSWVSHASENSDVIGREKIEKVIRSVMGEGETARKMRRKAQELQELGKKAMEVGGSSYDDLSRLLKELESFCF